MEASDSRNRLHAWKNILNGHDVINQGACWRIGDAFSQNLATLMVTYQTPNLCVIPSVRWFGGSHCGFIN